jgi:hypothetical protein
VDRQPEDFQEMSMDLYRQIEDRLRRIPGCTYALSLKAPKNERDFERIQRFERLTWAWRAVCNLEADLAHDVEAARFFRVRQVEMERALRDFERV